MITDKDVKQLFVKGQPLLTHHINNGPLLTQFYRGKLPDDWDNQVLGACTRHMLVFKHFNAIPKYCFSCYKIVIEPQTVVELFKIMMIFEKTEFPNDNTRKCLVEGRPTVTGTYKAMVYCQTLEEGEELMQMLQPIVSEALSKDISMKLKRGCSEYAASYPSYAQFNDGAGMVYDKAWQAYEDHVDKNIALTKASDISDTHNRLTYCLNDYLVMLTWLKYAATIGDSSYLIISGTCLQRFKDLQRPAP